MSFEKAVLKICPICGKEISDLSSALANKYTNDPAHFDCILNQVKESEVLAKNEKIVYIGAGSFGVIEFKDKSERTFLVKRRIVWEEDKDKYEWRKEPLKFFKQI